MFLLGNKFDLLSFFIIKTPKKPQIVHISFKPLVPPFTTESLFCLIICLWSRMLPQALIHYQNESRKAKQEVSLPSWKQSAGAICNLMGPAITSWLNVLMKLSCTTWHSSAHHDLDLTEDFSLHRWERGSQTWGSVCLDSKILWFSLYYFWQVSYSGLAVNQ